MMNPTTYSSRYIAIFLNLISLLGLLVLIASAFSSQPLADDLHYHESFLKGFGQTIANEYFHWNGRYTAIFFMGVLQALFYHHYPIIALLLLVSIITAYLTLFNQLFSTYPFTRRCLFTLTYFFIISGVAIGTPQWSLSAVYQHNFWLAGGATYQLGLVFFIMTITALITHERNPSHLLRALICLLCLLASGTNEIMMGLNLIFFIGLALKCRKWYAVNDLLLFSFCAVMAAAIVYFAPGNITRATHFAQSNHNVLHAAGESITHALLQLFKFTINPVIWLFAIAFYSELKYLADKSKTLFPTYYEPILLTFLTSVSLYFIPEMAMGGHGPARAIYFIACICLLPYLISIIRLIEHEAKHYQLVNSVQQFMAGTFTPFAYLPLLAISILLFKYWVPVFALMQVPFWHNYSLLI